MDRRQFLKTAMIGSAAWQAGSGQASFLADHPASTHPKNWAWIPLHPDRPLNEWQRLFATMRASNVRAVLPEIYDGRHAYFASSHLPVGTDVLARILPTAHEEGLEVHAWMWTMPCLIPEILAKHSDWYNVNANGESAADKPAYVDYYKFLDPGRPDVREWVQATVRELASIPGLSGIHLDYVRHPDAILPKGLWSKYKIVQDKVYPPYDYGYTPYEREQFKKKYGLDPMEFNTGRIKDPAMEAAWEKFRLDMVVDLVNVYLVPAAHGGGKQITAAVFPGPSLARLMVRQDWGRFQLDGFLPMLYHAFYEEGPEWLGAETKEGVAAVQKPVYSGIFVQGMKPEELARTIKIAMTNGASGVSLFSADGMDTAKWKTLGISR